MFFFFSVGPRKLLRIIAPSIPIAPTKRLPQIFLFTWQWLTKCQEVFSRSLKVCVKKFDRFPLISRNLTRAVIPKLREDYGLEISCLFVTNNSKHNSYVLESFQYLLGKLTLNLEMFTRPDPLTLAKTLTIVSVKQLFQNMEIITRHEKQECLIKNSVKITLEL